VYTQHVLCFPWAVQHGSDRLRVLDEVHTTASRNSQWCSEFFSHNHTTFLIQQQIALIISLFNLFGQRWVWLDGCVTLSYKPEFQIKGWESKIRWHNLGTTAKQAAMVWHMLRKEDNDWVKKWMEYEVQGARSSSRPKKTWTEIVEKDCQARKLNREEAMDRAKWSKQIRDDWWRW